MQDVLLINPPLHFARGAPRTLERTGPHLGLLYMAAWIHRHSDAFRVRYLDLGPERIPLPEVVRRVRALRPFVVGISVASFNLQGAVELARAVREASPGTVLFGGGPHLTLDPGFVERNPGLFDHVVTGEAERTFLHALEGLRRGETLPSIQTGEPVADLDSLPFPDRTLVRRRAYHGGEMLLLSRGCSFPCYFCSAAALRSPLRYRSVDGLLAEIEALLPVTGRRFQFADDTFTCNRDLVLTFCRAVRERRLGITWQCGSRVDMLDEELIAEMGAAGCRLIGMGIESASERIRRDVVKKGRFTNEDVRRIVRTCHRHGVRPGAYFILGHPTESVDDLRATREMILGYGFYGVSVQILLPYPGTELFEIARAQGIVSEEIVDRFARKELGEGYGSYPLYAPPGVDTEFLIREMHAIQRHFYLRPSVAWRYLRRDLGDPRELLVDARQLLSLVRSGGSVGRPYTYRATGASAGRGSGRSPTTS